MPQRKYPHSCQQSALFDGIESDSITGLFADRSPLYVAAGNILLSPTSTPHAVYFICSGSFSVHIGSPEDTAFRLLGPGELVGEISLIRKCQPSAYVIANESSSVVSLTEKEFWDLVQNDRRVGRNLMAHLADTILHNTHRVINERRRTAKLELWAHHDALTGLHNRRWLDQKVMLELARCRQHNRPLTLALLDVDCFHRYNARHGHQGGDRALTALAQMLRTAINRKDSVARYGGEEFAVLLPSTALHEGAVVAERLRLTARELAVFDADGQRQSSLTVSIGLAESWPKATLSTLFAAADAQLYRAKVEGRDQCCHSQSHEESRE